MEMKRLAKRVLSFVLALSMVLTMSAFSSLGQVVAKADDVTYKLYFELPEGTTVSDWGVNCWGGGKVTAGNTTQTVNPKGWGESNIFPTLLADDNLAGWGYVEITGNIEGLQFVNAEATVFDQFNSEIISQNITVAYFSTVTKSWFTDAEKTNEIKAAEILDEYYVAGSKGLIGAEWKATDELGKMTKISDNVFSITFKDVPKGDYEYKILKSPTTMAWKYSLTGESNAKLSTVCKSNVTISIDTTDAAEVTDIKISVDIEKLEDVVEPELVDTSSISVATQVSLLVDDQEHALDLYTNGLYETAVELEAGEHTAYVVIDGKKLDETENTLELDDSEKIYFRFSDGTLKNSVNDKIVMPATWVGNFSNLSLVDDEGSSYEIDNWNPKCTNGDLEYIGGGIYKKTFKFNKLEEDTVVNDTGYKVAFNHSWDYSIGSGAGNKALTIPAGRDELTIYVDEPNQKLYDDVNEGAFTSTHNDGVVERNSFSTKLCIAGTINGWSSAIGNGYDMTQISDSLYLIKLPYKAGTYQYKCVFGDGKWFENGGDKSFSIDEDEEVVVVYNAAEDKLYDSVGDKNALSILLGMAEEPAKMSVLNNKNGTTTFVATGDAGKSVALYYGNKADVEVNGKDALTKVELGTIKKDSVSSGNIFFGDAALDIVYYYEFDGEKVLDASNETVTVGGDKYSNYKRAEFTGRIVNVPGTFPGPSWNAASNQMEYVGNGLYKYVFKAVPAANYEYKISFETWAENYGVGGVQDGPNYSVTVPATQDVTIFYYDLDSHLSVTSLNYSFVDAYVEGTGVEKTTLKDDALTGVYSGTVALAAGTYNDITLYVDGEKYITFGEFELTEDKDISFFFAPDFGIAYNNAEEWNADADGIEYDSKNIDYKKPYGAVEQGEDVTFSIKADDKVTDVKLVAKFDKTKKLDLVKGDNNVWSVTTSFDTVGEYDYFFLLYSGPAVKVYCDDSGCDYGKGTVTDITAIQPYDLVVYKSGYTTPDWMKNGVIYQIFPDRFANGDTSNDKAQTSSRGAVNYEFPEWYQIPENPEQEKLLSEEVYKSTGAFYGDGNWSNEMYGGDLEGITKNIDYLKALGVTVIYLNPVFSSISTHRYDATDYTKIDPILGDMGDFTELCEVADANGMKIVLDGVFNHVSDDSIYFDRYYKFVGNDGKVGAYPYWAYVYDYMTENEATQAEAESEAKKYFESKGVNDFSYTTWFKVNQSELLDDDKEPVVDTIGDRAGKPVYGYEGWWGYDSMPVIMSTNGSEYQTGNWASEIIEGSNSVGQYWISKGSNGWRLDVANEVSDETWQHFRSSVKSLDNDAVIIGEIWDDATEYLMGDMYDSVMNYIFRGAVTSFAKGGSAVDSTARLEKIRERYPEEAFYAMMNLVGSHDTTRLLSYLDGIDDDRNQKEIENAFPTYENTSDLAKERQYLVAFLQFTYAGAPTIYYGDEIGMVGSDDPDDRRAFTWGKGNKDIVEWYAKLGAMRNTNEVLRTGSVEPITIEGENADSIMAYVRRDDKTEAIVLSNNTQTDITYTVDLNAISCKSDSFVELISGENVNAADGKVEVTIPALRGVVLASSATDYSVDTEALKPAYDPAYVFVYTEPVAPPSSDDDKKDDDKKDDDKKDDAVKTLVDIKNCQVSIDVVEYVYDGTEKKPVVTVKDGEKTLELNKDYAVKYADNTNVGTASVVVTGINDYTGEVKLSFTIKANETSVNKKQDQVITNVNDQFTVRYGIKKFALGAKANTALTYESSNTKVLTISKKGIVRIKGAGVATITINAAEENGYNAATKTVKVIVKKAKQKISVKRSVKVIKASSMNKNASFEIGASAKGKVTYTVAKNAKKYIKVSKAGKVSISKNIKKGVYKIVINAKATRNYKKASRTITVIIK